MGIALHIVGAIAITMAIAYNVFLAIPSFIILGFFWEKTQHRYEYSIVDGKLHREKRGWFGWMTKHRIIEGAGWPIGALVAAIAWVLIT